MITNTMSTSVHFDTCLSQLEEHLSDFVNDPGRDFTRHRLLDFKTLVKTLMALNGKTLNNELIDLFIHKDHIPSESALIQQRNKLSSEALHYLLRSFQLPPTERQLFYGYRLLAVDGSGLQIANDKEDLASRHFGIGSNAPFNEIFVHSLYDILQQVYVDLTITKLHKNNEPRVFVDMLQEFKSDFPVIFIGDMNYSSFNVMAHIKSINQSFLLRTKDITSNGSASTFKLPDEDIFDLSLPDLTLTRLRTAEHTQDNNHLRYLARDSVFDFLSTKTKQNENQFFQLPLRIVRFQITEDKYETIYTNLDPVAFPLPVIKQLYTMRWGIETSFRRLKHTLGVVYTHSKKADFIFQEIFAKAIMFNFIAFCTASIIRHKGKKGYSYTVNFSVAANLCKKFFLETIDLLKLEENIFRQMNPIRPSKSFDRKKYKRNAFKSFMYRVA
ncbi:MAG: IS4 family transposase [Clostridia bacterium]|nr:IS4 family transposase [Clostridia bacterium]MBQ7579930.1 IS4 family transposase [Clostridia bacterium]